MYCKQCGNKSVCNVHNTLLLLIQYIFVWSLLMPCIFRETCKDVEWLCNITCSSNSYQVAVFGGVHYAVDLYKGNDPMTINYVSKIVTFKWLNWFESLEFD